MDEWQLMRRSGRGLAASPNPERTALRESKLDRALLGAWERLCLPLRSWHCQRRLGSFASAVNEHEDRLAVLSEAALRQIVEELRARLVRRRPVAGDTALVFAIVREVVQRHRGQRLYPVQLLGGAVMLGGGIAEMQTGEGKTLTALLPAVAAGLAGLPVHVVTVNDYLAHRDANLLAAVYRALGLSVGLVEPGQSREQRRRVYTADVVYCTNKELVFDYLRDRQVLARRYGRAGYKLAKLMNAVPKGDDGPAVLRGLHVAIIDEADSVLIDEARTPFILSGQMAGGSTDDGDYARALELSQHLVEGKDFEVSAERRQIRLLEAGGSRLSELTSELEGLWAIRRVREEIIRNALSARLLFHRDVHYVVADDKVQIVDEFTGRVMPDRSWEHGLHQLIEAKEGCSLTRRKGTLQSITFQTFFRRYLHFCGMTGTATEVAGELRGTYGLRTVRIPTNRPVRRANRGETFHASSLQKWRAVVKSAVLATREGRAVLIGTRSVEASEQISALLTAGAHQHVVLNARQDAQEAEIVARAGEPQRITVATNMAGRGTDIALHDGVRAAGGLHVILTEFHESRRIDRQLFGRAGRQGDPGSFEAIVALDDELFHRFGLDRCDRLGCWPWLGPFLRRLAQARAERVSTRARQLALKVSESQDQALDFAGRP